MENASIGLVIHAVGRTGVLHQLTGVIARHEGDITSVEILDNWPAEARTYFEVVLPGTTEALIEDLRALADCARAWSWSRPCRRSTASGSSSWAAARRWGRWPSARSREADRHNIRGEHISVDTIPLVGEQKLADAVRAVARLPRAKALVLAGSLMGGRDRDGSAGSAPAGAAGRSA